MRDEAVKEMKAAINSTMLKLRNKEVELASSNSPDDNDITRAQIAEVKDIVAEMEGRVSISVCYMVVSFNRFKTLDLSPLWGFSQDGTSSVSREFRMAFYVNQFSYSDFVTH